MTLRPVSGASEIAATLPSRTPMLRTASRPDSGSTTRPLTMTRIEVLCGGRCGQAEREPALEGRAEEETGEQTALHFGAGAVWLRFAVMSSGSLAPAFILSVIVSPLTLPV